MNKVIIELKKHFKNNECHKCNYKGFAVDYCDEGIYCLDCRDIVGWWFHLGWDIRIFKLPNHYRPYKREVQYFRPSGRKFIKVKRDYKYSPIQFL